MVRCDALAIAASAYRRLAQRAEGLGAPEHRSPTRLAGWTVADLLKHVTWGAAMEAAALLDVADGHPGTPAATPHPRGDDPDPDGLARAVNSFESAIDRDLDPESMVRLPAGTVPLSYAAPLFAFEAALHASDLEHALGGDDSLTAAEIRCCVQVVGPMLDVVADSVPGSSITIDVPGLGLRLVGGPSGWHRAVPDDVRATTTIEGSMQDMVLFLCGRLAADDKLLRISGDRGPARRFKEYFPGP